MATVSERVYSELPEQPATIVDAFDLEKTVPKNFCTQFLGEYVKSKNILQKNQHDLGYSTFQLDPSRPTKNLPKIHTKQNKLSCRQRRKLMIHSVPKTSFRYSNFLNLHHLWLDYMKEMLKFDRPTFNVNHRDTKEMLLRADFHGCMVKVTQSKCPSYVGVCGIIIQDTKETFKIINSKDVVKTIPKVSSIFTFNLGAYEAKIFGKSFNYRPMDRITRKFKDTRRRILDTI